nr:PIG-L deacetylase family protein [Rhodococcus triatomae]
MSEWQGPELSLAGCTHLVVVAPHPDDEVLGVGALAATAVASGIRVTVLAVTDGEASHPDSPTLTPQALVARRIDESERAAECLGVPVPRRLGFADGGVAGREAELSAYVARIAGESDDAAGSWVLATWRGDGHPDHEAVGRAAAQACAEGGHRLLEYPVWMWHWATPGDAAVPWERAAIATPDREVLRRKEKAVQRFRTQIAPLSDDPRDAAILPPWVLERLTRGTEVVFL